MSLYAAKQIRDGIQFVKFDNDLNPEKTYIVSKGGAACDCPAGVRPTCRHRQMYWTFHSENKLGTDWFYDYEAKQWTKPLTKEMLESIPEGMPLTEQERGLEQELQAEVDKHADIIERAIAKPEDKPWRRI